MGWGSWGALGFVLALSGSAHGIIMGQIVNPQDRIARSTVMLLHTGFMETGRGLCSGTLVAQDLVMTAAHCVVNLENGEPYPASRFRIYFGNFHRAEDGTHDWMESRARDVRQVIPHEGYKIPYNGGDLHDIALVRLKDEAPSDFEPATLLTDLSVLGEKQPVTIAGFGNIKYYGDPSEPRSRLLRSFKTFVHSARNEKTGMVTFVRPTTIRTDDEYRLAVGGMAGGDSGGPGFVEVGSELLVFGVASGYRDDFASYENVPTHLEWLRETARRLQSCLAPQSGAHCAP